MPAAGASSRALIGKLRTLHERFGRDASLVLLARVLQNGNGFLLSILIVRRFGIAAAGTLAISSVATVVIGLLGTFGLPYVFARMNEPIAVRNTMGYYAALLVMPLTLPFAALLGAIAGRSHDEAMVIAVLAFGGPFFAQTNICNALQVLQGRAAHAVIPPAANLMGLVVAAIFGSTYLEFAIWLALFRFGGSFAAFLTLPRSPLGLQPFLRQLREGARFLTADTLNLGADQATVLISSYVMSRGDLGLFGLCRQMLTVSDTPGWSQMQTLYPAVVAAPERMLPVVRRTMVRLGAVCGVTVALLIVPLSHYVFHVPEFMILGPLLMTSVPLRYLLSSYDLHLRAVAAVRRTNQISLVRAVLAVIIVPSAAWFGGAVGAVLGTIAQTVVASWITRRCSLDLQRGSDLLPDGAGAAAGLSQA